MCGDCLRADVGGDPLRALGGAKECERCASGNFVTTKLGSCGLGSSVLGVLGVTAKGLGDSSAAFCDCDNFGVWDACGFWDACEVCDSGIAFGDCDNLGFWDACDACDSCDACDVCDIRNGLFSPASADAPGVAVIDAAVETEAPVWLPCTTAFNGNCCDGPGLPVLRMLCVIDRTAGEAQKLWLGEGQRTLADGEARVSEGDVLQGEPLLTLEALRPDCK